MLLKGRHRSSAKVGLKMNAGKQAGRDLSFLPTKKAPVSPAADQPGWPWILEEERELLPLASARRGINPTPSSIKSFRSLVAQIASLFGFCRFAFLLIHLDGWEYYQ